MSPPPGQRQANGEGKIPALVLANGRIDVPLAATDGIEADVIVVASGLASIARHFPPQRAEPVLVVDFADDFDKQAREATQQRREAYKKRGWKMTTDQPVAEGDVQ